jgi:hypothetical protein
MFGPSLTGLRGTQITGSISYTLVNSLLCFFKQYMKLQEDIDMHEDAHEFAREDKIVRLWSEFTMEKQMMETYTLPL